MATLVKFLKHPNDTEVFAFFPQLNYNNRLYNNNAKVSYAHLGQHSACSVAYANECVSVDETEYKDLKNELEQIGYDLKICK